MAATNGFFGQIQGPFQGGALETTEDIFSRIRAQCKNSINYITKIGIHYPGNFNFDLNGVYWPPSDPDKYAHVAIKENNDDEYIIFQIGKTRMLELEDVHIVSIKFLEQTDSNVYIDYQYK